MKISQSNKTFWLPKFAFTPTLVYNKTTSTTEVIWLEFYKQGYWLNFSNRVRYMIHKNPNKTWNKYKGSNK